jgi:subtilisin family serine protease
LLDYLHEGIKKVALPPEQNARSTLDAKDGDKVDVRIRGSITPALLGEIRRLGGTVHAVSQEAHVLSALVPLDAIEPLATLDDVMAIRRAAKAEHNWSGNAEGLVAHAIANPQEDFDVRKTFGVDGSGVKVCVLSNSVRFLTQAKENFTLGDVTVLPGQDGVQADGKDDGEGTAMLEIIHGIAPGAELMFATADDEVQMPNNITALGKKGCNIIVDDMGYSDDFPFQDDEVSKTVNKVTDDGILYISSAGNDGNKKARTSKAWEGPFKAGTRIGNGTIHVFDPDDKQNGEFNTIVGGPRALDIRSCRGVRVNLFWNDPLPPPGGNKPADLSDYELYAVDANGHILKDEYGHRVENTTTQTPHAKPYRGILIPALKLTDPNRTVRIVIFKTAGKADGFLHLDISRTCDVGLQYSTSGVTRGHNAAEKAISVAAKEAPRDKYGSRAFEGGPNENVNWFSSEGPRRMFFAPDGSPYNPPLILQKPDVTAADGVTTDVPGSLQHFYGTSAAAPQVAGIAALMWSKDRTLTADQIKKALRTSATQIGPDKGWNSLSGFGVVNAEAALRATETVKSQAGSETSSRVSCCGDPAGGENGSTNGEAALRATNR